MAELEKICHFCKEHASQNDRLYFEQIVEVNPHPVIMCDLCIEVIHSSVQRLKNINKREENINLEASEIINFSPREVFAHLNKYIIAQDDAKKTLSVAIYQHYERLKNPSLTHKSNIMIVGPTGSGKTELARSVSNFLNVPFIQIDVTTLTPRGYVGDSPEILIEKLLNAANGNVDLAEKGIIFLDEFDKIPSGAEWGSFKSKAVQQELLRIIEGDKVDVKIGGEQGQKVTVDTSKILFIAAGAFVGLEDFVNKENVKTIGLANSSEMNKQVTNNDLAARIENKHFEQFGIIPEMMGRLPVVCFTSMLSKEDLCKILTEPKGSVLSHYQSLFNAAGAALEVTHECLLSLSDKAIKDKLGARGLKKQLELKLKNLLFDIDLYKNKKILVSTENIDILEINQPVER
jgi:ATP-dependent Clp protease ATP-binding subunit ClpX